MQTIPYSTQWIEDDDVAAVVGALRLPNLTQGPLVDEFEKKVAGYCGARYAVAVNSGTSALHIACLAAGIKAGDEVITSPITFVASANCVLYCGGRPVFADVQEDTMNIDPKEIEKKITKRTKAVIPVHFAGHPCDMEEIYAIAKKYNLIVIEDAAHALGAEYKVKQFTSLPVNQLNASGQQANRKTGQQENKMWIKVGSCTHSDMTVLSFHAVKHITTGEGGMVTTNDESLYKKLLMLRTHGITRDRMLLEKKGEGGWYYEMHELGYNFRITDFQCALGMSQLKKIGGFLARRREVAAEYQKAFAGLDGLTLPVELEGVRSSWHLYPIRVKGDRKEIFNKLRENGIGVNVHYLPVYLQPYYQQLGYKPGLCPNAENYYEKAISLPMFPKLSSDEIDFVIQKVKEAIKGAQ